jgi:hypothetical protein
MKTTPNQLIHIGSPIPFDADEFLGQLQVLMDIAYGGREDIIHEVVSQVVPTYRHAGKDGSEHKGRVYAQQIKLAEENAKNNEEGVFSGRI